MFLVSLCMKIRWIRMESLQHIISQKHELLARETFSRQTINYSEDMPVDQKDRYIHYLVDKVNELDLDKRAMEFGSRGVSGHPQQRVGTTCRNAEKHCGDEAELHENAASASVQKRRSAGSTSSCSMHGRTSSATNARRPARTRTRRRRRQGG